MGSSPIGRTTPAATYRDAPVGTRLGVPLGYGTDPVRQSRRGPVLTFPFSWRRRLTQDGGLLGRLTRIAVERALAFYAGRAGRTVGPGPRTCRPADAASTSVHRHHPRNRTALGRCWLAWIIARFGDERIRLHCA
jgi:hypothetical protein